MNNFEMKNFYQLLDKTFWIPSYQRGYRWEKQQVKELLDDLEEFIAGIDGSARDEQAIFYCLQPVVVKPRNNSKEEFDVIDGQQRLTTVYLILTYLESTRLDNCNNQQLYKLKFERRTNQDKDYIADCAFIKDMEEYKKGNIASCLFPTNIDNFFIFQAYCTISEWFDTHKPLKVSMAKIFTGELNITKEDQKRRDVRVIWYEIDDDETSPIDTFARLNEGQIKLTETDLVKALLLQSDCYDSNERSWRKEIAFRHSCEWDNMEKKLQNSNFWAMLAPKDWDPQSHLELVISFIATDIKNSNPNLYDYSEDKKDFSFLVINDYIKNKIQNESDRGKAIAKAVEDVWERIQNTFNVFYNWFLDRDFYHLIGLLTLLNNYNKKDQIKFEEELLDMFNSKSKEDAKDELRKKIGELIKVKGKIPGSSFFYNSEKTDQEFQLCNINYEDNKLQVVHVLEAFNIYLYLKEDSHESIFQFDKFRDKKRPVTSLEHIHPQHLHTEDMPFKDVCTWFNDRKDKVKGNEQTEEAKRKMESIIKEVESQETEKDRKKVFDSYTNDISQCEEIIDKSFDELAEMKPENMHTLGNMALVDKDTNSALSNSYLFIKRNTLRQRENEELTYVPAGTYAAFDKRFSKEITDMKFWSPDDRAAYYGKIEEAYNFFTNEQQNQQK